MKRSKLEELKQSIGQHVLITYKFGDKNTQTLRKLVEADFTGILVSTPTGNQIIHDKDIIDIKIKNLSFINPRTFFFNTKEEKNNVNILMDAITTRTIEQIKNLDEYFLVLRYATFTKKISLEKERHKKMDFEIQVFNWIKKPQYVVQLCPLALLNNTLLLAIYMKKFIIFKKNLSIVLADTNNDIQHIIDFIFEHNDKLSTQRGMSLKHLAEDLL